VLDTDRLQDLKCWPVGLTIKSSEEMVMRKILVTVFCILTLVAARGVVAAADSGAGKASAASSPEKPFADGPAVYFPSTSYNFATVLEGEKIEHVFVVENRGKAPLRIGRVRPD